MGKWALGRLGLLRFYAGNGKAGKESKQKSRRRRQERAFPCLPFLALPKRLPSTQ